MMELERLTTLDQARSAQLAGARARAMRRAAEQLGDTLRDAPPVRRAIALAIDRVPCEARIALDGALRAPVRWVELERRMLFVELDAGGVTRRIVVDPVVPGSWRRTPWGAWLEGGHPRRARAAGAHGRTVEQALATIGVSVDTIDLAILTHARAQDLRGLLGTARGDGIEGPRPSVFPRARWVVSAREWSGLELPHDLERPHLVRAPRERVDETRLVALDHDAAAGASLAIVGAPGLTEGSLSVLARDAHGVLAWSPHGVAVDCWSPYHACLPGLRERVRMDDAEAIPRGDAFSRGEALASMAVERAAVDRQREHPAMHRVWPAHALCAQAFVRACDEA